MAHHPDLESAFVNTCSCCQAKCHSRSRAPAAFPGLPNGAISAQKSLGEKLHNCDLVSHALVLRAWRKEPVSRLAGTCNASVTAQPSETPGHCTQPGSAPATTQETAEWDCTQCLWALLCAVINWHPSRNPLMSSSPIIWLHRKSTSCSKEVRRWIVLSEHGW